MNKEKYPKLELFTERELKEQLKNGKIDTNFMIEYIVKRDEVYNKLIDKVNEQEQIIREAREYIENHSLYEEEYDYDFEENIHLSGVNDTTAKKDLLEILDRNVK